MAVSRITKEELQEKLEGDVPPCLVDVRLKYPYEHSTVKLPGAVRVAPPDFDLSSLPRDRYIVAYDSDPKELVSARIVAQLIREESQSGWQPSSPSKRRKRPSRNLQWPVPSADRLQERPVAMSPGQVETLERGVRRDRCPVRHRGIERARATP
jgi:hypothetical protein